MAFTSKRAGGEYLGGDFNAHTDRGSMITLTAIVAALAVGSVILQTWSVLARRQRQDLRAKTA
jgi:hypothetical protein